MKNEAFIRVPREFFNNGYYENENTFRTVMFLYYYARFLPGFVHGIYVDIGQVLMSVNMLSEKTGLPRSTLRQVIKRLEKDSFLTVRQVNKRYTLFTLNNYPRQPAPSTMLREMSDEE